MGGRGNKNPVKEAVLADTRKLKISDSTAKRAIVKAAKKPKRTKDKKPKRKTKGQKQYEAYFAERDRLEQGIRQQWVAEGRAIEDYEADDSVVWHWVEAWRTAGAREENEAWLLDHPDNPLPEHLCSLTNAERKEYDRWRAQRKPPSQERILALKSLEHLALLQAAWGAADKDARDKFRLYITEADDR